MANTPKTIPDVVQAVRDYTREKFTTRQLLKDTVGWTGKNIADETNIEAGTAWNGDTNSARARWIIPISDAKDYIASISGTNNLDFVGYITSPTEVPSAQSLIAVSSFPVTVEPNSGDEYVIFGFNKTDIAVSDVTELQFMLRDADDPDSSYEKFHSSVKTDLSDYHVVPSKNSLLWDKFVTSLVTNQSGTYSYNASTNVLTVTSSSVTGSGAYLVKEKITEIFGLNSLTFPIVVSVSVKADKTCSYTIGSADRSEYVNLTANTWYRQVLTFNNSSTLTAYNWAFYSNDTSQPTVEIKDMMVCTKAAWDADNTYVPYYPAMRDGMFPRSEQAVLAAKNLCDIKASVASASSITLSATGFVATSASGASYPYVRLDASHLENGREYILTFNVSSVSGNDLKRITLRNTSNVVQQYVDITTAKTYEMRFTYTTGYRLDLFLGLVSHTTTSDAITVSDVMTRLASDTDATFASFAMTNRELTKNAYQFVQTLTSSNDLNNIKNIGLYAIRSAPTHSPEGKDYCILEVMPMSNDMDLTAARMQRITHYDGIYVRVYSGNPLVWSGWIKYTGTAIS